MIFLSSDDVIANLEQIHYIDLALLNNFAPGHKSIRNADHSSIFCQIAKIKFEIFLKSGLKIWKKTRNLKLFMVV